MPDIRIRSDCSPHRNHIGRARPLVTTKPVSVQFGFASRFYFRPAESMKKPDLRSFSYSRVNNSQLRISLTVSEHGFSFEVRIERHGKFEKGSFVRGPLAVVEDEPV